jgi:peptide/nickel transport system permease protein
MRVDYLVRRIVQLLVVLWGAATLNFILPRLAPGNPVRDRLLSLAATGGIQQSGIQELIHEFYHRFGLDQPVIIAYFEYLWNEIHLDFGQSIAAYPENVSTLIAGALPWTIGLLFTSTVLSFIVGTILGALIAWSRAPRIFRHLAVPMMTLSAIPYYLLGLVLVYVLAIQFRIFPASGGYSESGSVGLTVPFILDVLRHSILPAASIVLSGIGFWALGMRGMMVTTSGEDYMSFAEAKGLTDKRIFFNYALRNAILPQTTAVAISLGYVVSGSVIVEVVFGYPGMGSLLFTAINNEDYFVIYGIVFMIILAIALATLLVDLIYPLLDPRITYRRT